MTGVSLRQRPPHSLRASADREGCSRACCSQRVWEAPLVWAIAGVLGFLLQFALIGGVIYLAMNFIRSRHQPSLASARGSGDALRDTPNRSSYIFSGGPTAPATALSIGKDDFDCFERLLEEIQTAYAREDVERLGATTTPEMFSYFSQDLLDNPKQRSAQ